MSSAANVHDGTIFIGLLAQTTWQLLRRSEESVQNGSKPFRYDHTRFSSVIHLCHSLEGVYGRTP
jgi:hypothetical protein